jgi:hypothetical protein
MAEAEGFRLEDYAESIAGDFPPQVMQRLHKLPDFRAGYELTAELNEILHEAGITGDFGDGGLSPDQWPGFGSVQKTLAEFKGAYGAFRDDMLALLKDAATPARATARPVTRAHHPRRQR